jgi:nitroreductase
MFFIDKGRFVLMNDVIKVIKNRRSVRLYREEQIKEEELQIIVEAGLWAPSGHNTQPWHITVIQDKKLLSRMSDIATQDMSQSPLEWVARMGRSGRNLFYNAPTVLIVSGKKEDEVMMNSVVDCSAAIQNIILAAESLDIGSCWIGLIRFFFAHEEEMKKLELPEGYKPLYAVCLGYKVRLNGKGPERKSGTVSYIR